MPLRANKSQKWIASEIGVSTSMVSRELKRNGSKRGNYSAEKAHMFARERKERFSYNRKFTADIESFIVDKLTHAQWRPDQIVGYCRANKLSMVSHECIYQFIRKDKQAGGDLYEHLRHKLKHRKRPVGGKQPPIKDRKRTQIINDKQRFGDWEIDLIVGAGQKGAILTLVERKTKFVFIKKLPQGKQADALAKQLIPMCIPYKTALLSITSDNGKEFAAHKQIATKLNLDFYFAHPYSSWERGLSQNTNKII